MLLLVTRWEIATAVGTILVPFAAAAAVIVALVVGARDRRAADHALQEQPNAARDRRASEHAELRKRQMQVHDIQLLVQLNQAIAGYEAHKGAPYGNEWATIARGLLQALPSTNSYRQLKTLGMSDWVTRTSREIARAWSIRSPTGNLSVERRRRILDNDDGLHP